MCVSKLPQRHIKVAFHSLMLHDSCLALKDKQSAFVYVLHSSMLESKRAALQAMEALSEILFIQESKWVLASPKSPVSPASAAVPISPLHFLAIPPLLRGIPLVLHLAQPLSVPLNPLLRKVRRDSDASPTSHLEDLETRHQR